MGLSSGSQYAVISDLTTYGLTSATLSTIDNVTMTAHLNAASDLVDSYLNSRFDLPLQSWGPGLVQKVCELAAESVLTIRGFDPNDPGDMTIVMRGKAAREWLEGIQDGEITPVVADSNATPGQFGGPNTLSSSTQPSDQAQIPGSELREGGDNGSPTIIIGRPKARGWR